jgi:hypothetical protein
MNTEQGFTLPPDAGQDITDIWEFIVEDTLGSPRGLSKSLNSLIGID